MSTLHEKMFVAQATLEAWLDSGKAEFDGQNVKLLRRGVAYTLEPAVRIEAVVDGAEDPSIIGKVITEAQILSLGGELLGGSVVLGEVALEVRAGYVAARLEADAGGGA